MIKFMSIKYLKLPKQQTNITAKTAVPKKVNREKKKDMEGALVNSVPGN